MKKQNILTKHPSWHLSRKERNCYYIGDMGRMAVMGVMTSFMTTFLLFQGILDAVEQSWENLVNNRK